MNTGVQEGKIVLPPLLLMSINRKGSQVFRKGKLFLLHFCQCVCKGNDHRCSGRESSFCSTIVSEYKTGMLTSAPDGVSSSCFTIVNEFKTGIITGALDGVSSSCSTIVSDYKTGMVTSAQKG